MELYRYYPGTAPVVVNVPHAGTFVPLPIKERMNAASAAVPDTDWYIDKLYDFCRDMGIHLLTATHSRYVVDLNRNREAETLYPGQFNTGVIPSDTFDKEPIYKPGHEPDARELQERVGTYWQPYHNKLIKLLQSCVEQHGRVVLFDAHSIKSEVPSLFEGRLPDLNLGTANGESADAELAGKVAHICETSPYSSIVNGRFKGGYITRHYGRPDSGVHAIQLEMAQKCYMSEEVPFDYSHEKSTAIRKGVLMPIMETLVKWVK